jgi:thiamine kinase-like enzyme
MPPHSESSVSTHADIAPRNILVDASSLNGVAYPVVDSRTDFLRGRDTARIFSHANLSRVTGVIDWEYAGWYPEY